MILLDIETQNKVMYNSVSYTHLIVSRGFVYVRESEPLMDDIKRQIVSVFESCADHKVHEWGVIKNKVKDDLGKLLYDRTRRTPMILPIIMEV